MPDDPEIYYYRPPQPRAGDGRYPCPTASCLQGSIAFHMLRSGAPPSGGGATQAETQTFQVYNRKGVSTLTYLSREQLIAELDDTYDTVEEAIDLIQGDDIAGAVDLLESLLSDDEEEDQEAASG